MGKMDKITALCKRRGFIFQGSEIYGGFGGFWDFGPLGVELKNNIKKQWWKSMVYDRDDVVGLDAAIIMNPKVWETSGHVTAFTDPLVECKKCHHRFRADKVEGNKCPDCGGEFTSPKKFNLLTEVYIGTTEEEKKRAYLRGEITQGVFVNFGNVVDSTRIKIPFGIAQIGKAFRNEITPGNLNFRSREFEQMELEYFIKPDEDKGHETFNYWKDKRLGWYLSLGMRKDNLRFKEHDPKDRAHYARFAEDIEYSAPFGWSEFEGIHHRGDFDLKNHRLTYKDTETGEEYVPWVIETSGGVDRAALFFLIDSYFEEEKRIVLKLHPRLAPVKVAVFPLLSNKPELINLAKKIHEEIKKGVDGLIMFDDRGNIGKRYFAQDEIGTPFCVTVDFQSLEDKTVTVRDRDTAKQERVKIEDLIDYFSKSLK
ncbi:MAG: glycine--tRNA ligase [Patescibacteria group bacterium]|nr:glycine--tRNA ligase [Patescibacteria group bacterium]